MSDDIESRVKGLAALVLTSGRLSEFHEKNLKAYPFIFFNEVKEVKIDYDLSVRHDVEVDQKNNLTLHKPLQHCYVAYYLTLDETASHKGLEKRYEALENATRAILWKNLPIEIYFNDKIMYKSVKNGR